LTQNSTTFPNPGNRIAVIGATGSGKTTLAQRLGDILDLPVIELDAMHWMPGWTEKPWPEIRSQLDPMTRQDRWVADGNYSQVRDQIWPRADTIIWLDFPFLSIFFRLFVRTLKRVFLKVELWNGNRERFRDNFLSRDSLFVWLLKSRPKHKKNYPLAFQEPQHAHLQVLRFTHPRQTEQWLKSLKQTTSSEQR
jgi:adenylate kinase family enzyme